MIARLRALAGVCLLLIILAVPAFADADDQPVYFQKNDGAVVTMKLERAQHLQAEGRGIILGSAVYPNTYYGSYGNTYPYGSAYPYGTVSPYTYPNGTYTYPYNHPYNRGHWRKGRWHRDRD